ncbi:MAG: SGNH/GDSL hydrolase family protein [Planctomycetaceae bacterium]|nr:SGNH/GDSL hydrolase family protein [Planctomycetaceae bacterium]
MHRSGILFVGLLMFAGLAMAADETKQTPRFELKDGDRVVLLGGTLIEREQKYGQWEAMLTARYPDRNITFRNLGWDGDTVWAESRGIFDTPEVGYARMIEQVKGLKPTVIFLGYGNNEAFAGKEGLEPFVKQYEKLIDDLSKVAAADVRFVFLLPMSTERFGLDTPLKYKSDDVIESYQGAIRALADARKSVVLDLPGPLADMPRGRLTNDGLHLNAYGYEVTGMTLQLQLAERHAFGPRGRSVIVASDGQLVRNEGVDLSNLERSESGWTFAATSQWLNRTGFHIAFKGLSGGDRVLRIDGVVVESAPTEDGIWSNSGAKGRAAHPDVVQYEALREAIIAKNELYFHSWRPQNVTYLFGFRKHEQGQNAKETAEFAKLVAEKEAEIARLKKPVPHKYELTREKAAK